MITFPETLDGTERVAELLKSATDLETAINDAIEDLAGFLSMLEYAHTKKFRDSEDALQFIDNVLTPQLVGIRDSLGAGTEPHLKRLKIAGDLAERLRVRLHMLIDSSMDNFLA
jgi:hypothetical protein